jgi:hypothetical protein
MRAEPELAREALRSFNTPSGGRGGGGGGSGVGARVIAVQVGEGEDTAMMVGAGIVRINCSSQMPNIIRQKVSALNIFLYLKFNSLVLFTRGCSCILVIHSSHFY